MDVFKEDMRLAFRLAYMGIRFHGFSKQKNILTVEQEILKAMSLSGLVKNVEEASVSVASRTDAGVSALSNVIVVDTPHNPRAFPHRLNEHMLDAWVWAWAEVDESFNPRYANFREYRYQILDTSLDFEAMTKAAALFKGEHDFTSFAKLEGRKPVHVLDDVRLEMITPPTPNSNSSTCPTSKPAYPPPKPSYVLKVRARYFLWNQVRRIASAIIGVGNGSIDMAEIASVLQGGKEADFGLAPPEPLLLADVHYDGLEFTPATSRLVSALMQERMNALDTRRLMLTQLMTGFDRGQP